MPQFKSNLKRIRLKKLTVAQKAIGKSQTRISPSQTAV